MLILSPLQEERLHSFTVPRILKKDTTSFSAYGYFISAPDFSGRNTFTCVQRASPAAAAARDPDFSPNTGLCAVGQCILQFLTAECLLQNPKILERGSPHAVFNDIGVKIQ